MPLDILIPVFDTSCMKSPNSKSKTKTGPWAKTNHSNIRCYVPSGIYFIHAKVGGKPIRESLKTDSITVAQTRRDEILKRERKTLSRQQEIAKGRMSFGDALKLYRTRIVNDANLKPRTKDYYEERVKALLKSWKNLERLDIRKITETDVKRWKAENSTNFSPNAYNHTISILKHVFEIGVEVGARYDNPADCLERVSEPAKPINLPTNEEFKLLVESMENSGSGFSRPCANLVRFLAYGGFRISEAKNITWGDVDMTKKTILVRGDATYGTKNGEFRIVPMIPAMQKLIEGLERGNDGERVMEVAECQKAMDRAAKEIGMKRITHHDLRKLFTTRCLEKGTPILTLAKWLGHKDKGALLLKTYGDLRQEHSLEMAEKVSFD